MALESYLSRKFRKEITKRGWTCIKIEATNYNGIPDRMIIIPQLPEAKILLVELKTKLKHDEHEKDQILMIEILNRIGVESHMVVGSYDWLLQDLDKRYRH